MRTTRSRDLLASYQRKLADAQSELHELANERAITETRLKLRIDKLEAGLRDAISLVERLDPIVEPHVVKEWERLRALLEASP